MSLQDRNQAGRAAELLLQKNLEITEIRSSEARTIAATHALAVKEGRGGDTSVVGVQGSVGAAVEASEGGRGGAKKEGACRLQ